MPPQRGLSAKLTGGCIDNRFYRSNVPLCCPTTSSCAWAPVRQQAASRPPCGLPSPLKGGTRACRFIGWSRSWHLRIEPAYNRKIFEPFNPCFAFRGTCYFPTQNRSKMRLVISSRMVCPVISPKASRAASTSTSTASGVICASMECRASRMASMALARASA